MQIHSFATQKYINLFTNAVCRQCGEGGEEMAICPKCHISGGNWRYCKACGIFFVSIASIKKDFMSPTNALFAEFSARWKTRDRNRRRTEFAECPKPRTGLKNTL
jgi:hypothetical protein